MEQKVEDYSNRDETIFNVSIELSENEIADILNEKPRKKIGWKRTKIDGVWLYEKVQETKGENLMTG